MFIPPQTTPSSTAQVVELKKEVNGVEGEKKPADEMTSKDYYFDSYAHFGIHEVSVPY